MSAFSSARKVRAAHIHSLTEGQVLPNLIMDISTGLWFELECQHDFGTFPMEHKWEWRIFFFFFEEHGIGLRQPRSAISVSAVTELNYSLRAVV